MLCYVVVGWWFDIFLGMCFLIVVGVFGRMVRHLGSMFVDINWLHICGIGP